jgi:hypothetical protein
MTFINQFDGRQCTPDHEAFKANSESFGSSVLFGVFRVFHGCSYFVSVRVSWWFQ